jgi:hypothetical protein
MLSQLLYTPVSSQLLYTIEARPRSRKANEREEGCVDTHNVFVSHRHEDDAKIADFRDLLKGRDVDIRDSSITAERPNRAKDPEYIKREILGSRIRWAGKIVVIVTPDTKNHDWINWEVNYANMLGEKRIIGVWAHGASGSDLPEALERHADAVVSWNADSVIDALEGADNWECPDGTVRPPQALSRLSCG